MSNVLPRFFGSQCIMYILHKKLSVKISLLVWTLVKSGRYVEAGWERLLTFCYIIVLVKFRNIIISISVQYNPDTAVRCKPSAVEYFE